MDNTDRLTINEVDKTDLAVPVSNTVAIHELPGGISSVSDNLDGRSVPDSMESISSSFDFGSKVEISGKDHDKDGDGIPDALDKNQGRSVADVAAEINRIGKYADNQKVDDVDSKGKILSSAKKVVRDIIDGKGIGVLSNQKQNGQKDAMDVQIGEDMGEGFLSGGIGDVDDKK